MEILSINSGLVLLGAFWLFMVLITYLSQRSFKNSSDSFLVANRKVGLIRGAFSIAASWIWAPALFIASQKAYQQGIPGVFWFTAPNILTLIIFGFLAVKIRKLMPEGYTLPQFMKRRFDQKTHIAYIIMFLCLQVCSVGVQLLAGAAVIYSLTGIPIVVATVVLALIFLSYSLISGLKASVITDFLQMSLILFTCFIIVPLVLFLGNGWEMLSAGLGGYKGGFSNLFDSSVAFNFGIIVTIGLLAGPIGDQQHWQRAFALKKENIRNSYFLSGFIFGVVPILLSVLGFVAAGMVINEKITIPSAQLCGVSVVISLLPRFFVILFVFMILSGLASTGDSALCAGSSIVAVDIYKEYFNIDATDRQLINVSRLTMVAIALLAVSIALIPGMEILYLFLFYGTLRACDMMPTILSLYLKELTANGVFYGITAAAVIGLPLFIYGKIYGRVAICVAATLSVVVISTLIPFLFILVKKNLKK